MRFGRPLVRGCLLEMKSLRADSNGRLEPGTGRAVSNDRGARFTRGGILQVNGAAFYKRTAEARPRAAQDGAPRGEGGPSPVRSRLAEDEADIAFCERHQDEAAKPLRRVLKKLGIDEREVGL